MTELIWRIFCACAGSIIGFLLFWFLLKRYAARYLQKEVDTAIFRFKFHQDRATKYRMWKLQEEADKILNDDLIPTGTKVSLTNMISWEIRLLSHTLHTPDPNQQS